MDKETKDLIDEVVDRLSWPLYAQDDLTSYLLEKLPAGTELFINSNGKDANDYSAQCDEQEATLADTPLKALLKLVKALADAGELK